MEGSWWKERAELDEDQQRIMLLPRDGSYQILGPPGSGKTNLLLLRARYLFGSGLKNIVFITLARSLVEFIKTGVGNTPNHLDPDQVMTMRKWALKIGYEYAPTEVANIPRGNYQDTKAALLPVLARVITKLPKDYYDAILVDEVQDFSREEIEQLSKLTERLTVAGDTRQAIYGGDGLDAAQELGLEEHTIHFHYRIGREICKVADRLLPSRDRASLLSTCQYNEAKLPSTVAYDERPSLQEQLKLMASRIGTQLKAYPNEGIGILIPRNDHFAPVREYLASRDFGNLVSYHDPSEDDSREFASDKRIFVLTNHSAKGTEFRAVHILGVEHVRGINGRRELMFTAATRAKTSLSVYYTGAVEPYIASAFAAQTTPDPDSLFP